MVAAVTIVSMGVIRKLCPLAASECPYPGAFKHIHTISIPLNQVRALCLCLHESSMLMLCAMCATHMYWCLLDDIANNFEIFWVFRIIMATIVKWGSRLREGQVEDRKL